MNYENLESRPSKITPELITKIREAFVADLEDLFTDKAWLSDHEDQKILDKIRSGTKLKSRGTYLEDILIGVAMRIGRVNSLEDIDKLKDEFFE